jgi:hypothetical protein
MKRFAWSSPVKRKRSVLAAVTCLLLCAPTGRTDNIVTVKPNASPPTPNPAVPQTQVTATLTASALNPPMTGHDRQIQGPDWQWSVAAVSFSPTPGGAYSPAAEDTYSVLIDQTRLNAADATLTAWFGQAGAYQLTALATVSYTDVGETWTGSARVDLEIIVADAVPGPNLSLATDKYAICAGGIYDPVHQARLAAVLTDEQGRALPNQLVLFTTTDGTLSTASATTDANGQATVTLTSSRNAADDWGPWEATVCAILSSQPDNFASVNIEFQAPKMEVTIRPRILNDGDLGKAVVTLTWNGLPVSGHVIAWRIARLWDGNMQLIYDDTGGPPYGYATLRGPASLVMPTDLCGQASRLLRAGPLLGRIEMTARDLSVMGGRTQKNKERRGR